nr:TetM/TetW/TetO/TetS family tetracycline resistance ribosomal protection protein [Maliibacterium massiliense]
MQKTIGALAHVDAGKTTLCEQMLYLAGALRTCGRVDHQDAFLDSDPLERQRGITIFADQADFTYRGDTYHLVDTPGHVDFAAQMERALRILDAAVVVVSAVEGVQAHTRTICRLLARYDVPAFFFINKMDRAGADGARTLAQIRALCAPCAFDVTGSMDEACIEYIAEQDDALLERYLTKGYEAQAWRAKARQLVGERKLAPCVCGAALDGTGVVQLLDALHNYLETRWDVQAPFTARAYRVRHDARGARWTYLKVTGGVLRAKDSVGGEKVHEIRRYSGPKSEAVAQAAAGTLCAVTGLAQVRAGQQIGAAGPLWQAQLVPTLSAQVLPLEGTTPAQALACFRVLEQEEPALQVDWQQALGQLRVCVMGAVQLEVLRALVRTRFGLVVDFGPCQVLYKETIARSVMGYGHFEPLRHYAEVHLRLEPAVRGSGVTFASACPTDVLARPWQQLIRTHVLERTHRGTRAGAPLTDVRVVLVAGRAHEKHTEGGDFRQATYRAVRQGLMQAEMVLLEPWEAFTIAAPEAYIGRVMADVQQMHGTFDPPQVRAGEAELTGRAPVAGLMEYSRALLAATRGSARITRAFDGYAPCHNAEAVVARIGYDCGADTEHTPDSIFCSHGAGYRVPWQQAQAHMHCK